MTEEDKDLLLIDLCSRLSYGVKVRHEYNVFNIDYISPNYGEVKLDIVDNYTIDVSEVKPYLFPLSSMTEEQKIECFRGVDIELDDYNEIWSKFPITNDDIILTNIRDWLKVIDWLIKNHFDYRGLIPKGLALDATGFNIY